MTVDVRTNECVLQRLIRKKIMRQVTGKVFRSFGQGVMTLSAILTFDLLE